MALVKSSLASALQTLFENMPASASDAATGMANAYRHYAEGGTFGPNGIGIADDRRDAMASTLLGAISNPGSGSPSSIAGAWAGSVATFWIGATVSGVQIGTTVGCPGASALTSALTPVFANLANTAASCASSMADALDTATKTVTATVSPPAGTTLTIA